MKRKIFISILFIFLLNCLFMPKTLALGSCTTKYEVGIAKSDYTVTSVSCHDRSEDAIAAMKASLDKDSVVIEHINGVDTIYHAKYALANLNVSNLDDKVTYFFPDSGTYTRYNMTMNVGYKYGGVEAAFIDLDNEEARVKISGYDGWVNKGDYEVVPLLWVKSSSYYDIDSNGITHCYTKKVTDVASLPQCRTIGPQDFLPTGKFYSYDGHYFYSDYYNMIDDYKEGTNNRAVNKDKVYYNYYMFLSHHSKTTYSSLNIDEYIRNILNKTKGVYGTKAEASTSKLYGQGAFYFDAQQKYGVNAILSLGVSINESSTGTSSIAIKKNNGFGHGAIDSDPFMGANGYLFFGAGIYAHAYKWITYGYAEAIDDRYAGPVLGDKSIGANRKYASDPYWGEKAAAFYYRFDKNGGFNDYNYYQLGVSSGTELNVRKNPSTNSPSLYRMYFDKSPLLIVGEENIDGKKWYKIVTDLNYDNNGNPLGYVIGSYVNYEWNNNYGYVSSDYVTLINKAKTGYKYPNDVYKYQDDEYSYQYYTNEASITPKVAITNKNANYYYDASLQSMKKQTVLKDNYVVVYQEARDNTGKVISYLVTSDYSFDQKEWINANDITFVNMDIGKNNVKEGFGYSLLYQEASESSSRVGRAYQNTYLVILEEKTVNGVTFLKVQNNLESNNDKTAWIVAREDCCNVDYTITIINTPPVIKAIKQTIVIGTSFNPLKGVTAHDEEDGDITNKIKVINNNVNSSIIGNYNVTYEVEDSKGQKTSLTIDVKVIDYSLKEGLFFFDGLTVTANDTFIFSGFLGIPGMNNSQTDITAQELILKNALTNEEYVFKLDMWKSNPPFEMSNVEDDKPYDYSGGWFKGTVDFSGVPQGDYIPYIAITNGSFKSRHVFNNLSYKNM
ncbi:MAG: DUF5011 domain-containing protein, partial [Bacilli bacterium]